MQAQPWTLNLIFSAQTRFVAPLFQRPYVWNYEDNWLPLWETVLDVAERQQSGQPPRPRFLGAIVLDQTSILGTVPVREIIDGQQRLTTLQILLAATRDRYRRICEKHGYTPVLLTAFEQMVSNNPPLQHDDDRFKVWPTNVDREAFRIVMTAQSLEEVWKRSGIEVEWQSKGKTHHLWQSDDPDVQYLFDNYWTWTDEELQNAESALNKQERQEWNQHSKRIEAINSNMAFAYFYFWSVAGNWLEAPDEAGVTRNAQSLLQALQNGLVIVVIGLDPGDDAQQIFETMNALGTPLLPADLVKNFLFREAQLQGISPEPLYESYWKEFDDGESWWRQEVRQGRLTRARLDIFLYHYLALTTRREMHATDLFDAYRTWARSNNNELSPTQQLARLHEYSNIYRSFESDSLSPRLQTFFQRLKSLDVTTLTPLLLELFKTHPHQSESLEAIAIDLESFLVRRLVCGLTTKNYNRHFLELLQSLETKKDYSPEDVRAFLLAADGDSTRWPNDREFSLAWRTRPIYRKMNQERLRLLLRALDEQMRTTKNEEYSLTGSLTIEHLMPQKWQEHWPLPEDDDSDAAEEQRDILIHSIGNLTLLSTALNPSISNGAWRDPRGHGKRTEIQKHSILCLNKELAEVWDEEAIMARSGALLELALKIWPYPA